MTFRELKRLAGSVEPARPVCRVSLVGDTATQYLAVALRGAAAEAGLTFDVHEAPFDQLEQELLDPRSDTYAAEPRYVAVYAASERLHQVYQVTPPAERERFAERQFERFRALWSAALAHTGLTVLFFTFAEVDDGIYGQHAAQVAGSFRYQLARLNLMVMDAARETPGLLLVDLALVQAQLGRAAFFDGAFYYAAGLAIALDALPVVARRVVQRVVADRGGLAKCLVLDLDNTLWGGIVGEDGLAGIQVGALGMGKPFTDLQAWARQLRERGILLAVCSKNDEALAKEPFERHPDMVLRLDDFAAFVAGWETKVEGLQRIARELGIGLDSLVFVDDNPFERQMVRELLPQVRVPELPEDPAGFLEALVAANPFEVTAVSGADGDRTRQYQQEAARRTYERTAPTVEAFLEGLQMVATAVPFDAFNAPRVAQLSQRSNQFNLRTIRHDEREVLRLAASEHHVTRAFTLADRFGDHGLVGVVILEDQADALFIDTWLMSCRVLKRGLEAFMLREMVEAARARGVSRLVGEYLPTPKNGLVAELLPEHGFVRVGERWELDLAGFEPPTPPIRTASAPRLATQETR